MIFFRKYIFPPLYGLLVYFTVRLLHDVESGEEFWKRYWLLNTIEISCSILLGYCCIFLFNRLFGYFDRHGSTRSPFKTMLHELLLFVGLDLILVNLIFTPMAALTDDGLSWADFVDVNMIPSLYAIVYYGIARSSIYLKAYVNNKLQLEKVTNDHLQTELKFLRAQYHPHFLFNALNTIYFQMDENVADAKKSIEKFSELLRYQLYDQQQQVPVKREIEYLESYIAFQKVRSSDKLQLSLCFDKQLNGQLVYPLLFLPLVENAFKFSGGEYKLFISAKIADGAINFRVENSVYDSNKNGVSGGIGLENLRRRLDLLYPGKHSFRIEKDDKNFIAELNLKL